MGAAVSPERLLGTVRRELRAVADPSRAEGARAYMKSAMPYHGVDATSLRTVCKAVFVPLVFPSSESWQRAVRGIWRGAKFREERYAAIELSGVRQACAFQTPEVLPLYEEIIVTGAWWDYVDAVAAHRVGPLLARYPAEMKPALLRWSRDENLWKRRTAILSQLTFKMGTDLRFLYACIEPSLGSKEFFLRKAIGWALRQYAWTDPDEVLRYVDRNRDRLSGLSRREALKNVRKSG
jgi:3-methyladenine DNA glycosylase AlkD